MILAVLFFLQGHIRVISSDGAVCSNFPFHKIRSCDSCHYFDLL